MTPFGVFIRPAQPNLSSGAWHASRDGGTRLHMGIDLCGVPGTPLVAWQLLRFIRSGIAYPDDTRFHLALLQDAVQLDTQYKFLYVRPVITITNQLLHPGDSFAVLEDISQRDPGILPHTHFEVWRGGVRVDPTGYFRWV